MGCAIGCIRFPTPGRLCPWAAFKNKAVILTMSLPHALLTALIEKPSSGSELASRFDRSMSYYWNATHQQIYRELGRLEKAAWVSSVPVGSVRGRKKIYKVLPAGRRELKRWTGSSEDPQPLREPLMLRLRAEAVVGPTGLRDDLARRLELHRGRVQTYRQIEARDFGNRRLSREDRIRYLTLKAGIMLEEFWTNWSRLALETLDSVNG
jgi:DNA-binding PadR family transcriptional regulator